MSRRQAYFWPATGRSRQRIDGCTAPAGEGVAEACIAKSVSTEPPVAIERCTVKKRAFALRECRFGQPQCRCPTFRHGLRRIAVDYEVGC